MRLFLASEVKHPECFKKLEEYVNGLSGKRIAYIPTAANGEFYGSWRNGGSWNLVNSIGADVTLVILEEKTNDEIKRLLGNQDIIWFAGGSFLNY
jgi:peptidase E